MTPTIIDTTLRDGEQAPGVSFSIQEKMEIASLLDQLGVHEVEAGTPAIGSEEREAIQQIANAGFSFTTSAWCRARLDDLKLAAKLKTQSVNISLPVSDIQIEVWGKDKTWVYQQLRETLSFATDHFEHVTMGAQDASRAEFDYLKEFIYHASDFGANRIRLSDTVGCFDPMESLQFFRMLKYHFPTIAMEFHGHNDLGMATANTIGAIRGGADCISATVTGLGERAGNAVLEEIIATLNFKYNDTRFNTTLLQHLAQKVAKAAKLETIINNPVVGANAFCHESGVHTSALLKNPQSYQVLNPEHYGDNKIKFVTGKHSSKSKSALKRLTDNAHQ